VLSLWKDILLQVLLSGTLIFQFPLLLDRLLKFLGKKNPDDLLQFHKHIVITSGISVLLCVLISAMNHYYVPLNLGVIPLFLGILYGNLGFGLCLAALFLISHGLINGFSAVGFVLIALVLVYSLLPRISTNFKNGSITEKICWLWSALIPAMLIIVASHAIDGKMNNNDLNPDTILVTILYMLIGIVYSGIIIYWIEISSKRLVEDQHEVKMREQTFLTDVMEMMPLGMVALDRSGNIIAYNQPLLRNFKNVFPNLTAKDIVGRPLFDLLEDMIQKEHLRNRFQQAIDGIESTGEIMRSATRVYSTGIYPLIHNGDGDIWGAVGIMEDITELDKLRNEFINVERLSLVGQMAASITHEIRNPMAVVRGFLQLMKEKSPETLNHYYRIVMEELDRANSIINDFLSLAQNRVAEKEECHLHDIVHELSPLLWADANLRGQSIELKLGNHIPRLHLNIKEMKQLILNMCRNGMEAMDDKGTLTIETRVEGKQIRLYIADTGIGIPEHELERLFEPFFTTKTKGTGLGLALCMSIVQRHHGTIDVRSQQGEGTVFIISFPIDPYVQGLPESQSAAASE